MLRGGAEVARQAHNLKAVGSIPTPATNLASIIPLQSISFSILQNTLIHSETGCFPSN